MYVCMGVLVLVSVALGRNLFSTQKLYFGSTRKAFEKRRVRRGGGGLAGAVTIIIMKACRA